MAIQDQIVRDPEPAVIITDLVQTGRQPDDQLPDIIHLTVDKDLLYIPIVREMFISVSSRTTIGSRGKTGHGRRLIIQDPRYKTSMPNR